MGLIILGQWLILRVVVFEHILSILYLFHHRNAMGGGGGEIDTMESTFHEKCHILAYSL